MKKYISAIPLEVSIYLDMDIVNDINELIQMI